MSSHLPKNKKIPVMCGLAGHKFDGSWKLLDTHHVEVICARCKNVYHLPTGMGSVLKGTNKTPQEFLGEKFFSTPPVKKPPAKSR